MKAAAIKPEADERDNKETIGVPLGQEKHDKTIDVLITNDIDQSALSQEEREDIFRRISYQNKNISRPVIDGMFTIYTDNANDAINNVKPTVPELLLRRIIEMTIEITSNIRGNGDLGNNAQVIPIIHCNDYRCTQDNGTLQEDIAKLGGAAAAKKFRIAKKIPILFKNTSEAPPNSITIRCPVLFVATNGTTDYTVPPNEECIILGLVINTPMSSQSLFFHKLQDASKLFTTITNYESYVRAGNFNHEQIMKSHSPDFETERKSLALGIGNRQMIINSPKVIMFTDDTSSYDLLSSLYDSLASRITCFKSHVSAEFVYTQYINNKKWFTYKTQLAKPEIIPQHPMIQSIVEMVSSLEKLYHFKRSDRYYAFIYLLIKKKLIHMYYDAILLGAASVQKQLQAYSIAENKSQLQRKLASKLLDAKIKTNAILVIIANKFGKKRLDQIEKQMKMTNSDVTKILTKSELDIVMIEYEQKQKYYDAILNNKCSHVNLRKQFSNAIDVLSKQRIFDELKTYFDKSSKSDRQISCKICHFPIMCPHTVMLQELAFDRKNSAEIKTAMTHFINREASKEFYYCKICGEQLAALNEFDDGTVDISKVESKLSEDMKAVIRDEIYMLLKFLQIDPLIHVGQMVQKIQNTIYPFIREIDGQIIKSRTDSMVTINSKRRIFIVIYALASMIQLVESSKGRVTFRPDKLLGSKTDLISYIKFISAKITNSYNVVIKEIAGLTAEIIMRKLIEAYKELKNSKFTLDVRTANVDDFIDMIIINPVFLYIVKLMQIKATSTTTKEIVEPTVYEYVDKIMGNVKAPVMAKKSRELRDLFDVASIPDVGKWKISQPETKIKKLYDSPQSNMHKLRGSYIVKSAEYFFHNLHEQLYLVQLYIDTTTKKEGTVVTKSDLIKRSSKLVFTLDPKWQEAETRFAKILDIEKSFLQYRRATFVKTYNLFANKTNRRFIMKNLGIVTRSFDANGKAHIWSKYIITSKIEANNKTVNKDDAASINVHDKSAKITDRQCSVCGVLFSQVDKINNADVILAISNKFTFDSFFVFYETRCPEKANHDWVSSVGTASTCSKCGLVSGQHDVAYFTKYKGAFELEKLQMSDTIITDAKTFNHRASTQFETYEEEYKNWKFNFEIILELSDKLGVSKSIIMSLSATEGESYSAIQNVNHVPSETNERYATRVYALRATVQNIIIEYNRLRNIYRVNKLVPQELLKIVDDAGISKAVQQEFVTILPDIYNGFNERFEVIQRFKKPREIVSFCIQQICEKLLIILHDKNPVTAVVRAEFVKYITNRLFRDDELVSKYDKNKMNWTFIHGDVTDVTKPTESADMLDDSPAEEQDEEEDELGINEDAFDMEEPDDPDDDDANNFMKVDGIDR